MDTDPFRRRLAGKWRLGCCPKGHQKGFGKIPSFGFRPSYTFSMGKSYRDRVQSQLLRLSTRFGENYIQSVMENQNSPFFRFYEAVPKNPIEKTFVEFSKDVELVRKEIESKVKNCSTIVVIQENSYELLVYVCAVLLEGRSLCLINPKEGQDRIQKKLLRIPSEAYVFVGEEFYDQIHLPNAKAESMRKSFSSSGSSKIEIQTPKKFQEDQPFIFIFTSGTTGEPKVVQQLEPAVMLNVDALIERHQLGSGVRLGTCLPAFHVNALEFSFFCTLFSGSEFYFMKNFDLPVFSELVTQNKLDIFSLVPSLLAALLRAEAFFPLSSLSSLRYFVSAAAPLSTALAKECYEKIPCRVLQGFGLSEAVNFSAVTPFDLTKEQYEWALFSKERPSIGTTIRGTEIEVWNEEGTPLPAGAKGELVICGETLMLGYRGEKSLGISENRRLPTGDLGFFEVQDGKKFFFLTGRKKEIIKRMGFTVSLAEVEDILTEFSSPKIEAIALGFENDYVGEELAVAFRTEDLSFSFDSLEKFLRDKLPPHMRPRLFIQAAQAVRTNSGKASRGLFLSLCQKYRNHAFGERSVFIKEELHVR